VTVYCKSETLNEDGMVTDFTHIKRIVKETFDHKYINEVLTVNPSSLQGMRHAQQQPPTPLSSFCP
jgi:6-pyruvoyltetrahydropterin/6-carboxytetrahydropterin synthase